MWKKKNWYRINGFLEQTFGIIKNSGFAVFWTLNFYIIDVAKITFLDVNGIIILILKYLKDNIWKRTQNIKKALFA